MIGPVDCPPALASFVKPILGLTAWGVEHRSYGSWLAFQFGQPSLEIRELKSRRGRTAFVRGQWELRTNCCNWKIVQDGEQIAWSEDDREIMARGAYKLNGQNLVRVSVPGNDGCSFFQFDLGGSLETWPYGDDDKDEQWTICHESQYFNINASGGYSLVQGDTALDGEQWIALR
ncbi:MAG: hypothetical protein EOO83_00690 [Oxalobacteraceae bacterium]|nr:MAG: hypothetical protein EOO83_00690 [Oxalobacteraceae bacterium]